MSAQHTIARPGVASAGSQADPDRKSWWHDRSAEELRSIMSRGPALGSAFDEASAELERRARERLREEEQATAREQTRNQRMRRIILEGLLLACILVVIAIALLR